MLHHRQGSLLPQARCGLGILVAILAASCSAGGGSSALQPGNASAASVSRTADNSKSPGSVGTASKPGSGVAPTRANATATPDQRSEAALDPLALAPAADAGASGTPPKLSTSPDPAGTPPSADDDEEEEDDEDDED